MCACLHPGLVRNQVNEIVSYNSILLVCVWLTPRERDIVGTNFVDKEIVWGC